MSRPAAGVDARHRRSSTRQSPARIQAAAATRGSRNSISPSRRGILVAWFPGATISCREPDHFAFPLWEANLHYTHGTKRTRSLPQLGSAGAGGTLDSKVETGFVLVPHRGASHREESQGYTSCNQSECNDYDVHSLCSLAEPMPTSHQTSCPGAGLMRGGATKHRGVQNRNRAPGLVRFTENRIKRLGAGSPAGSRAGCRAWFRRNAGAGRGICRNRKCG